MTISFASILAASIAVTLLIIFFRAFVLKTRVLSRFGINSAYLFCIFILLRAIVPVDFYTIKLTKSFYSYKLLPTLYTFLSKPLFTIRFHQISLTHIAMLLWLLGAIIFLSNKILGYFKFKKTLTFIPDIEKDCITYHVFEKAATDWFPHLKTRCRIIYSDFFDTPALFGWKNPVILLPDVAYTEDELYYVFAHELLHIHHKDFFIKLLCDMVISVYWWNPVISLLLSPTISQIQELSIDYALTHRNSKEENLWYLSGLNKTLVHHVRKTSSTVSALVTPASQKQIRQRFTIIMTPTAKRLTFPGIIMILILFLLSFTFVFEASYSPTIDEKGRHVYNLNEHNSYYIRNGEGYDLFLDNKFVIHVTTPYEELNTLPIYNSPEEVPN